MIVSRYLTDIASASTASDIQLGSCTTEIGAGAFSGFTNISEVELPENLTTIGYSAFTNSSLTKVTIPSGVTSIGKDAFKVGTRDRRYTVVMDGTTPPTLGSNAFSTTYLNNIYVLAEAYNDYVQAWPDYSDYIVYNGINYKVTLINATDKIIIPCNDSDEVIRDDIKISATTTMFGSCATSIGNLLNKHLGNVVFSSSVKNIGNNAFDNVRISSLTFAEGLETIGQYSFSNIGRKYSSGVTNIDLPKSLKSIGRYAFEYANLDRLTINGDSGVILGESIFSTDTYNECRINNLIFSNVATIPEELCAYSSSTGRFYNVEIKNTNSSITNIGASAFTQNVVQNVSIDNANIGSYAFASGGSLTSASIKSGTIGDASFRNCSGLASVTIGNGVTSIGGTAFYSCGSLTSVTIPDSVISIGASAFGRCTSLTSINIPSGITNIDYGVFQYCSNLRKLNNNIDGFLNIPNSITSIGERAFYQCRGFTSIDIHSNVLSIGKDAFKNCTNLSKITIRRTTPPTLGSGAFDNSSCLIYVPANSYELYINAENWSNYKSRIYYDGMVNYKALLEYGDSSNNETRIIPCDSSSALTSSDTSGFYPSNGIAIIGDCVTTIGSGALRYYYQTVKISNSVTTIESNAFESSSSLKVFDGGENITTIGDSAFTYCSDIVSITIPKIESIGNYAFRGCSGLTSVYLGNSLISIGDSAFSGCSKAFTSLELKNGVSVGNYAFANCGTLTSVTIDSNSIGFSAFQNCTVLNSINIGSSVTSISDSMLSNCYSLTSVTIPDSVTTIGEYAFNNCSGLTSCTIPDSVTSIGAYTFNDCSSLIAASLPSGLTSIAASLFRGCLRLLSITIPSGVTSIGGSAFYSCRSLTSITVNAITPPTLGSDVFADTNECECPIYVPATSVDAYKEAVAEGWSNYASRIQAIPNSPCDEPTPPVSANKLDATYNDGTSFSIPCDDDSSLTRSMITAHTTSYYDMITAIIGNCVTEIGFSAFQSCYNLTSVTVNASTPPTLGGYAFDATNNCPIYVPAASVDAYKAATIWSNYASRIQAIPNS